MTDKFHTFVDLCCSAFNTLRRHGNLLLTLFALMATSGIPGVTNEAVSYIQQTLLLDLSNEDLYSIFSSGTFNEVDAKAELIDQISLEESNYIWSIRK